MKVTIYSDGSAKGNPGNGGYGTILQARDKNGDLKELELTEGFRLTTNNRMELMGAIVGFEALTRPCEVTVISDSQYLVNAFNNHWIEGWQKKGWKKADKSPVLNRDLWERLLKAMKPHVTQFVWVKGHAGHPENERCDRLAFTSADGEDLSVDTAYEENGET